MPRANHPWTKLLVAAGAALVLSCNGGGGGKSCDLAVKGPAGAYHIELQQLAGSAMTDDQLAAFADAKLRIEGFVTGELSTVQVNTTCNMEPYAPNEPVNQTIGGLLIFVKVADLGSSGVLALSGPCLVRSSSHLPLVGVMIFNSQYLDTLPIVDLHKTVLHEMLHVLGFGTLWPAKTSDNFGFGLLSNAGRAGASYTGYQALCGAKAQNEAPGTWSTVPVEDCSVPNPGGSTNCGGESAGTRDSHWRWNAFGPRTANELMTGWITSGAAQPLSATTIASLHDLGYEVDVTKADAYTITPVTASAARTLEQVTFLIPLGDDVLHIAPAEVDDGVAP